MSVNIEEVAALVANGIIEFEINNPGDRIFWTPEDVRRYSSRYGFANEIDGFAGLDALKEGDLRALNKRIAEIMTAAIDPLNTEEVL